MDLMQKRRRYLILSLIIQVFNGFMYAWNAVQAPLSAKYGWSSSAISLAYTLNVVGCTALTLFGADLKKKLGLRRGIFLGGIFSGLGLILCGLVRSSVLELYFYYGVFYGIGVGLIYPTLTVYAIQLYPERSGLASGLSTSAFSMGALIWAPAATALLKAFGDVTWSFLIIGALMLAVPVLLSFCLREVPAGFVPPAPPRTSVRTPAAPARDVTRAQMLRSPTFYALLIGLSLALSAGSMIVSYSSSIVQTKFQLPLQTASVLVGSLSIASALGRMLLGALSDRIGKRATLLVLFLLLGGAMASLIVMNNMVLYISLMVLSVFCHGGICCMVSPITKEVFGERHFAENYSVMYLSFTLSAFFGPVIISRARDLTGDMTGAYLAGLIFCAISAVLALYLLSRMKKERAAAPN